MTLKNNLFKRFKSKTKYFLKKTINNMTNSYKFNTTSVIGIQEALLSGLINPHLHIVGTTIYENPKLKVLIDNEEVELTFLGSSDKKSFIIDCDIPRKAKQIKFLITIDSQDILVIAMKNNFFKRLNNKIKFLLKAFINRIKNSIKVIIRGIKFLWKEHHFLVPPFLWKKYFKLAIEKLKKPEIPFYDPNIQSEYLKWLQINEKQSEIIKLKYNPLISILIPVYNVNRQYLEECIDSILEQSYENFEVCLVDDASTKEETKETLKEYETKDERIRVKYRKKNGHISNATNDALKMAKGEFIALVDNDDVIAKNALYENVLVLNKDKNIDMIYSDEDKLDLSGKRCTPHFKPDFSPDTLMSLNYICHFTMIRKKIVEQVGGFEVGLEGAQDHDLFLKISEVTKNIHHISKILYHWRMIPSSTSMSMSNKDYASDKGKIAIENALKRRKLKGTVKKDLLSGYYQIKYQLKKEPLISIIIPTRDYADITEACLNSIFKYTTYKNFEIIIVNNNSEKPETFELFKKYTTEHNNVKVIDANFEFNYSKLNNIAVKEASGEYVLLLNNDTEVITPDWLEIMVGYASLPHVGCVGPKLLYPDTTVQHAGVILGLGGVASHAYIGSIRDDLGLYGRLRVPYNYSAVTAACLMISKKKYSEVKGLEENLKVAYNDIDFNIKILQKGYYNLCVPQVELFHHESKSRGLDTTSEKYKRFLKESEYMYNKWDQILLNDKMYNSNFTKKGWFLLNKNQENNNYNIK